MLTREVLVPMEMEQNSSENCKGCNMRPRIGKENNSKYTGGLAHSHIQKSSAGRKSFLNKVQIQATKEILEGEQATIGRALKVRKAPNRGP